MGTCLPPVMRTSQQEHQEALLCREGFLCHSPIQHQRWTWPQRLLNPLSLSTQHLSRPPTYQRPTTNHAKRSMPKKLGQAKNLPLRYSSNQFLKAADSQVPADTSGTVTWQRWSHSPRNFLFLFVHQHHSSSSQKCSCGFSEDVIYITKSAVDRSENNRINIYLQDPEMSI